MKKKDLLEIILKSLIGIPVGIALLMVSYGVTYFIAGQDIFQNEIEQLKNVNVFINQLITVAIIGLIVSILIKVIPAENEFKNPEMKKFMIKIIIGIICMTVIPILINISELSKNITSVYLMLAAIMFAIALLIRAIKDIVNSYKINKKIKERQQQK